jgi:GntR family transcriptional regulator, transcriptional repressor for pyruvate dehydrogenase complex
MTVQDNVSATHDGVPRGARRRSRDRHPGTASAERATESAARASVSVSTDASTWTTPVRTPKAAVVVARALRQQIVTGKLNPGDHLPHEAELIRQFAVSRATLREAVRLLESDRLIEVKRGSRTGALITLPGADTVARPAGFLLQFSGATLGDVYAARSGIEPAAVNLLARSNSTAAVEELESIVVEKLPTAWEYDTVDVAIAEFHRRLVELSGNVTLGLIAAMLFELIERCTRSPRGRNRMNWAEFDALLGVYRQLLTYVYAGDEIAAESFWQGHLDSAIKGMPHRLARLKIRDMID